MSFKQWIDRVIKDNLSFKSCEPIEPDGYERERHKVLEEIQRMRKCSKDKRKKKPKPRKKVRSPKKLKRAA